MDAFILTLAFLAVFLLIRNAIVLRASIGAAYILCELCGIDDLNVELESYGSMIFDIRKWTFKQFYPSLAERSQLRYQ